MTAIGHVQATAQPSAGPMSNPSNMNRPISATDDESTPSSSVSELFDREPKVSSQADRWKLDINGNWLRYGSTESATSTGLSSMCSSVATNDKQLGQGSMSLSPRKRMADGSVKQPSIKLGSVSSIVCQSPTGGAASLPSPAQDQTVPKKRRGRPPKPKEPPAHFSLKARRASEVFNPNSGIKPRSSIPSRLPVDQYARQCIEAAHSSRLDPFALHSGEHVLLEKDIMSTEVTIYLNIRNAILRLWTQNPIVSVTAEEAAGCAKEARFFGLARVAYQWLVRNGYINFGCVEVPRNPQTFQEARKHTKQRTIVVVGAGVAGLTTARQLEGLIAQNSDQWCDAGEKPPRVIILEGRKRIGGRVYSKPLVKQVEGSLPGRLRNTAEMGAMIVTGFERGNPLNAIIRAQLGLRYHLMTDALTIYDTNGEAVEEERDNMITELYTDISDRAGDFRAVSQKQLTMTGDKDLIGRCRDPIPNGFATFQLEPQFNPDDNLKQHHKPTFKRGRRRNAPPGTEKLTGRSQVIENTTTSGSAARAAIQMGFELQDGVPSKSTVSLRHTVFGSHHPTLGAVMDEAIAQYQEIVEMTPQDLRLLNWHHANLEYANASPVSWLSLSGHDQDNGNEFEGAHSEIIGGYSQLPRGLMSLPTKLDVRFGKSVESIHYDDQYEGSPNVTTKVVTTDGEVFEADEVVVTAPLGVLKTEAIDFDPLLPDWKCGAINRMGFGLLNKIIMLYDKPFWDDSRDMFGLLNEAEQRDSLDPAHYARRRGRFYLIWNCSKTCGRPMLIALLAGHAAYDAENTPTPTLMAEVTERLRKTFTSTSVPEPEEVIVTRWKSDPFTRGTYSYVGAKTQPQDYDLMAESVGNLHFAGEATCGTHPATVHGAFLSGLRAAADVMNTMAGEIEIPKPLVLPSPKQQVPAYYQPPLPAASYQTQSPLQKLAAPSDTDHPADPVSSVEQRPVEHTEVKAEPDGAGFVFAVAAARPPAPSKKPSGPPRQSVVASDPSFWVSASFDATDLSYEVNVMNAITTQIGERPEKPKRPGVNPFLLYTTSAMEKVKQVCADEERNKTGVHSARAGRNSIRTRLGEWWRAMSDEEKLPYQQEAQQKQDEADRARKEYEVRKAQWDKDAESIRAEYVRDNPPPNVSRAGDADAVAAAAAAVPAGASPVGLSRRKTNVSTNVALDFKMV